MSDQTNMFGKMRLSMGERHQEGVLSERPDHEYDCTCAAHPDSSSAVHSSAPSHQKVHKAADQAEQGDDLHDHDNVSRADEANVVDEEINQVWHSDYSDDDSDTGEIERLYQLALIASENGISFIEAHQIPAMVRSAERKCRRLNRTVANDRSDQVSTDTGPADTSTTKDVAEPAGGRPHAGLASADELNDSSNSNTNADNDNSGASAREPKRLCKEDAPMLADRFSEHM